MAKKPATKQPQGPKLTVLINKYASEIAELKETIHDPNLAFGYTVNIPT